MSEIYKTGIPQKVRVMFDEYANLDLSIEENRKKIEEFAQYLPFKKYKKYWI